MAVKNAKGVLNNGYPFLIVISMELKIARGERG